MVRAHQIVLVGAAIVVILVVVTLMFALGFGVPAGGARRASVTDPPVPEWRADVTHGLGPLSVMPEVRVTAMRKGSASVVVTNNGPVTLVYCSAGPHHPQLFWEHEVRGVWRQAGWDWCGTGKNSFELAPGASVKMEVRFLDVMKRERMLTCFTEKVGTFTETSVLRSGMVVLAAE